MMTKWKDRIINDHYSLGVLLAGAITLLQVLVLNMLRTSDLTSFGVYPLWFLLIVAFTAMMGSILSVEKSRGGPPKNGWPILWAVSFFCLSLTIFLVAFSDATWRGEIQLICGLLFGVITLGYFARDSTTIET